MSSPRTGNHPRHAGPAFAIAYGCLAVSSSVEEVAGEPLHACQQLRIDAVAGHSEEAERAAGGVDRGRHAGDIAAVEQGSDVDQRQLPAAGFGVGGARHGW